jgi:hypothetical protein
VIAVIKIRIVFLYAETRKMRVVLLYAA